MSEDFSRLSLNARRVLVTGASSGLGRAAAVLLSRRGAEVILVGRNMERLRDTATLLDGAKHAIEPFELDAVDAIPGWLRDLSQRIGPLNALVHSAGIRQTLPVRAFTQRNFAAAFNINVAAAFALVSAFRQRGVCHVGGSIVLLSSAAALSGESALSLYSAAKGALISAVRSFAIELAPEKIRVNCVAPALVDTEMTAQIRRSLSAEQFKIVEAMHPLGLGTPDDVAEAIAFLVSDASRWITGTTLVVDGGYTAR